MSAHQTHPGRDFAYPAVGAYDRRAAPSGSGPAAMYPRVAHPVPSAAPFSGAGGTTLHMPVVTAVGAGPAPIAVAIKTQLRVAQQPPLAPVQAVPVSAAAFDFDVERQLLSEASALHQRTSVAVKREVDPRASKYIQIGMDREAVIMALAMHGDSHSQVVDFCNAYTLLREMGFDPVAVAGCLALCGNDRDRALQLLVALPAWNSFSTWLFDSHPIISFGEATSPFTFPPLICHRPFALRPPTCRSLSLSSPNPVQSARSEKLAEMGGGLGGETRIFARGQTIFWRLLQLATAVIALGVMTASNANGMYFQYYQAFIFMVAAMTAVAAWSLAHLLHSIGRFMTRKWRITLFAFLDFVVAWIALAGASAAAGLTTFADKGSGMVQPGYCQMGLFSSFCARTKAATAFAFITFFVLIPSLIASATRAVVSWFED
ncbi:unnamed protein product [Closterium sp. Yama58-4]|nr:unnamed protein product [Closterium sp. Yama58-4]